MSSNYPSALDDATVFPEREDGTTTAAQHAADHNNLADAVIKIQTELGVEPSGVFDTIVARLTAMNRTGTLAGRGAAASYTGGRYFATDVGAEYVSNGTDWIRVSASAGEKVSFPGLNLPAGLVRSFGQPVSRTGIYAEVFAAHTITSSGSGNSGQAVLTFAATPDGVGAGCKVEGAGVNAAATVLSVTATTVTLSHNLTTSGARTVRFLPNGGGDGSTTFNLPDYRGKADFGRDTMGGAQVSNADFRTGSTVGAVGGKVTHVLTEAQMPTHSHVVNSHDHGGLTGVAKASFVNGWTSAAGGHSHSGSAVAIGNHAHTAYGGHGFATSNWGTVNVASGGAATCYRVGAQANTSWDGAHGHSLAIDAVGHHQHTVDFSQNAHSHSISAESPGTNSKGSSEAHENRPPFIITDQCIRL